MAAIRLEHICKSFGSPTPLTLWPGGAAAVIRPLAESMVRQIAGRPAPVSPAVEEDHQARAVHRGDHPALDDVSLDIKDGETMSVIGPSGCGKTTLLRVIAGLELPDAGRVLYNGADMAATPPKDRGIGMVFQNYALYPHLKGKGNLSFFFRMHHREDEVDARVRATAEIMGMGFAELLDRRPRSLSGGQRQRVAIARCIVRDPSLFLFDEPLSSLDAKLRAQTRVEIKRLLTRFHITSVYVTHDQVEAVALADRIAVMREGHIEQVGTYWDIYRRPVNCFVAGFLGSPPINLLSGWIDGHRAVLGDGQALALPEAMWGAAADLGRVLIGIRAEQVRVMDLSHTEGLLAQVDVVEHLPSERAQLVHLHSREWNCVARAAVDAALQPEDWVRLELDQGGVLLFNAVSERRVAP